MEEPRSARPHGRLPRPLGELAQSGECAGAILGHRVTPTLNRGLAPGEHHIVHRKPLEIGLSGLHGKLDGRDQLLALNQRIRHSAILAKAGSCDPLSPSKHLPSSHAAHQDPANVSPPCAERAQLAGDPFRLSSIPEPAGASATTRWWSRSRVGPPGDGVMSRALLPIRRRTSFVERCCVGAGSTAATSTA